MERYLLMEESETNGLDVLKYKYPQSIISHRVLDELYKEDPSEDKILFHWMALQNIKSSHKADVNNRVIQLAKDFFMFRDKLKIRDINFYHDAEILQNEINNVRAHLTRADKLKYKIDEGDGMYEDSKYQILRPVNMHQICNAGYDTEWCSSKYVLPKSLEDYKCYVIINKKLTLPDINDSDYDHFHEMQDDYNRNRKFLILFHKSFKGDINQADLDDYYLIDAANELCEASIADVVNPTIERKIFADFQDEDTPTLQMSLNEQYQNPELNEDDKVELVYMADYTKGKPNVGEKGVVIGVDKTPFGLEYKMKWDGGSTLSLIPEKDIWIKAGKELNEAMQPKLFIYIRNQYEGKTITHSGGSVTILRVSEGNLDDRLPSFPNKDGLWFTIRQSGHGPHVQKIKNYLYEQVLTYYNIRIHYLINDGSPINEVKLSPQKRKSLLEFVKKHYIGKTFEDFSMPGSMVIRDVKDDGLCFVFYVDVDAVYAGDMNMQLAKEIEDNFNIPVDIIHNWM
jgi:hypothetical protein